MNKRNYHLLKKFGITNDQYDQMYRAQEGRCAVCKRTASTFKCRLSVDHDHTSGEIRGLLCTHCNRYVVGRYRKGYSAELLKSAYDYLIREYTGWIVPPKIKKKRKCRKKQKTPS